MALCQSSTAPSSFEGAANVLALLADVLYVQLGRTDLLPSSGTSVRLYALAWSSMTLSPRSSISLKKSPTAHLGRGRWLHQVQPICRAEHSGEVSYGRCEVGDGHGVERGDAVGKASELSCDE